MESDLQTPPRGRIRGSPGNPLTPRTPEEGEEGAADRDPFAQEEGVLRADDAMIPAGEQKEGIPERKEALFDKADVENIVQRVVAGVAQNLLRAAVAPASDDVVPRTPPRGEVLDPIPVGGGGASSANSNNEAHNPGSGLTRYSVHAFRELLLDCDEKFKANRDLMFYFVCLLFTVLDAGFVSPFPEGGHPQVDEWAARRWEEAGGEESFVDMFESVFGAKEQEPEPEPEPENELVEEPFAEPPIADAERKVWDSPMSEAKEPPHSPSSDDEPLLRPRADESDSQEEDLKDGEAEEQDQEQEERGFDENSFSDDEPLIPADVPPIIADEKRAEEKRPHLHRALGSGGRVRQQRDPFLEVPNGRNRQRLRVDDGGEWAQRAQKRAAHFTKVLRDLLAKGDIDASSYDGRPITAAQWNNIKDPLNTPYLRGIFERDRRSEYQSMHRKEVREKRGEGLIPSSLPQEAKEPPAKRAKTIRAMRSRAMKGIPVRIRGRRVDLDAPIGDIVHGGGGDGDSKPLTARDVLGSMDQQRSFRPGKGLVDKPFHSMMVNPKNIVPPDLTDEELEKVSQQTSLVCLWTLMYFSNQSHGDELVPGISEVVFNIAFEDIMNLLRMNPSLIPESHRVFFEDPTFSLMTMRWSKKNAKKKYSDVTEPFAKLARDAPNSDFFKLCFLVVNSFTQIVLADKLRKLLGSKLDDANTSTPASELFQRETLTNTNLLMNNLSISPMKVEQVKQEIPITISENIANFIVHANSRLSR